MNQKEHPWEECVTDAGCGHRGRGEGDICGVLTPSSDFSGLSSEGEPGKDPHAGQANVTLYVHALEIPSGDAVGGDVPLAVVIKLWHEIERGKDDKSSKEVQVQLGDGDETEEMGHGAGAEGGVDDIQYV